MCLFFKETLLFLLFFRNRNRDEHTPTNRQGLREKTKTKTLEGSSVLLPLSSQLPLNILLFLTGSPFTPNEDNLLVPLLPCKNPESRG